MSNLKPSLPSRLPQVFYDFDAVMRQIVGTEKAELQTRVKNFVSTEKLYVEQIYNTGIIRPVAKIIYDYLPKKECMEKAVLMANNYIVNGLFRYIEYDGKIIDTNEHKIGTFKKIKDTLKYKNPEGKGLYYDMAKRTGNRMFIGDMDNGGTTDQFEAPSFYYRRLIYELFLEDTWNEY